MVSFALYIYIYIQFFVMPLLNVALHLLVGVYLCLLLFN